MIVDGNIILFESSKDLKKEIFILDVAFVYVNEEKFRLKYEVDTIKIVHELNMVWSMYLYCDGLRVATITNCDEVKSVLIQTKELSCKCLK